MRHWEIDSYMLDYQGRPAVHVALLDVTEQHEAQAAKDRVLGELRESEARFRRRSAELESLHAISLQLNAQVDTAALLQQILDQAVALLDVEAGLFFLYDPERDQLIGEIATEYLAEFIGMRLARGEGLSWQVFESLRAQTVTDYARWPNRVAVQPRRPLLRNLLAAPLIGKEGVLGVLNLASEGKEFGDQDIWLAELFAAQAYCCPGKRPIAGPRRAPLHRIGARREDGGPRPHGRRAGARDQQSLAGDPEPRRAGPRLSPAAGTTSRVPGRRPHRDGPPDRDRPAGAGLLAPALAPRRPVAVDEIIRQTVALASKQLQRSNIRVTFAAEPGLIVAVGPDQIVQVFLNLVINAVDAIGRDGAIEIRAAGAGDRAVITVANDGPAIAQHDLPHVFEPFYTTKTDGTGLGLAVSQNLVAQYGGQIAVANQDGGRGVIFTVHLPLAQTESIHS